MNYIREIVLHNGYEKLRKNVLREYKAYSLCCLKFQVAERSRHSLAKNMMRLVGLDTRIKRRNFENRITTIMAIMISPLFIWLCIKIAINTTTIMTTRYAIIIYVTSRTAFFI